VNLTYICLIVINVLKYFRDYFKQPNMTHKQSLMIIIGLVLLISIESQLLAIDFGTQFIKASVVHSGAGKSFSIVENSKSERKFINALGFYN
jgi:hypothetical protein